MSKKELNQKTKPDSGEPKRNNMFIVPWDKLRIVPGLNIREDYGDLEELADQLLESGGPINPVIGYVQNGLHYVVHGHRRFMAGKLIYERTGQVLPYKFVKEGDVTDEQRVLDMVLTNTGLPLTPLEWANAVDRLLNIKDDAGTCKYNIKEIAKKLGKSVVYVSRLAVLNSTPAAFKQLVVDKKISGTLAIKIAAQGAENVEKFVEDYKAGKFEKGFAQDAELENTEVQAQQPATTGKVKLKNIEADKINSRKALKAFIKSLDGHVFKDNDKRAVYELLKGINNNTVTTQYLHNYFF